MPSTWTHIAAGFAVGALTVPRPPHKKFWFACAIVSAIPDIDAVGRPFGRGDLAFLGGHRALTHSITFALVFSAGLIVAGKLAEYEKNPLRLWLSLACVGLSHASLDILTTYGEGIALLSPWMPDRFRIASQPIGSSFGIDFAAFVGFYIITFGLVRMRRLSAPRALGGNGLNRVTKDSSRSTKSKP